MEKIQYLPRKDIKIVDPKMNIWGNVRSVFDPICAKALQDNIRDNGLLNALLLRKLDDGHYLLGGERRFRAISKLVNENVPCYCQVTKQMIPASQLYEKIPVKIFVCSDAQAISIAIADNVARVDLSEIEKINACMRLDNAKDENGKNLFTRPEIAAMFGVSQSWVSQTISIGEIPEIAKAISEGILQRTAGLKLLKTKPEDIKRVIAYAKQITEEGIAAKIDEVNAEIKELEEKVEATAIDAAFANLKYNSAPDHSKVAAGKARDKAHSEHKATSDELEQAKKKLASLSRSGNSRTTTITADTITKATEDLQVRTGKSTPFSIKEIKEMKKDIEETIESQRTAKTKRDLNIMLHTIKLILREVNAVDIMDALKEATK